MSDVEVNTESLETSDGGTNIPCSKRQKTESTATQSKYDCNELPDKEKTNDAEQQNGTEFPNLHSNHSSLRESMGNETSPVSKFEEDNGQHNEKNGITVPENNAELENELILFYKELEKIENETDLLVNECVDGSQGSAGHIGNVTTNKHEKNKIGKKCKKITNDKAQTVGDPCTGKSQIPTTEHSCDAHWHTVMTPSRPHWNHPQAFIGPQGPLLPRFNIPLTYQRYSGSSQGSVPFRQDELFLSNGYGNDSNRTPIQAENKSCDIQACPTNDYTMQPEHKYFYNSGAHQNMEGRPNMLRPGLTNLCQQYQKTEQHSRPGIGGKELVFMRGPPGSGKSTLSRLLLAQNPNGVVLSTDDYFCQNGVYWFDPNFLGEAHEWNQNRAKHSMNEGRSPIIIDNTNIQAWEMKPYAQMAVERRYRVSFREPETWWKFNVIELENIEYCIIQAIKMRRNKHRVPREKIIQMMERFEYPISSDIVLNAVEPSRNNKVLLDLHPRYNQRWEGPVDSSSSISVMYYR
ncbi:NEDD4-binding protein 2-like 2 isoform X2 [Carcharodon carcharias]|nr:NEDD4-binding protein 2-like 2 isoform X2 [Carcharodon carcharias]XP_041055557.1 NEDD4-binding protein 2-like 2 isoform X2 [Carcharodon carcharias]